MDQLFNIDNLVNDALKQNAKDLQAELEWFEKVLDVRSGINAGTVAPGTDVFQFQPPDLSKSGSPFAFFVNNNQLTFYERFLLFMALVPHIKPQCLDIFMVQNKLTGQVYTEFGGRKGKVFNGFLPTADTFMFVLAGDSMETRFGLMRLFDAEHIFWKYNVLETESLEPFEPLTSIPLTISRMFLESFTTGESSLPRFGNDFPAMKLNTPMNWEDMVLPPSTANQLSLIDVWLQHNDTLLNEWEMSRKIKPGYKSLFHGPPGTGKSLAAALLGKKYGIPVFRIDLSKVVSKFIGETGKNLSRVFDRAENMGWILFFDEADSLFGKRTQVADSHDRYSNQETSFLLQRIEEYSGLVILASNFRNNLDEAFIRRFQSVVDFPVPAFPERLSLWQKSFPERATLDPKLDLKELAQKYELSGGHIMNVVHYSSLQALKYNARTIQHRDVMEGIKIELAKSGRTI